MQTTVCLSVLCALLCTTSHPVADLIRINPSPPTQGGPVEIEYIPSATNNLDSITLDLDWTPAAQPDSVTIDLTGNPPHTATVTVPGNATSLTITDPTGDSDPLETNVTKNGGLGIAEIPAPLAAPAPTGS